MRGVLEQERVSAIASETPAVNVDFETVLLIKNSPSSPLQPHPCQTRGNPFWQGSHHHGASSFVHRLSLASGGTPCLVLDTTHRLQARLDEVEVQVCEVVGVFHVLVVGEASIVLTGTPPVAVVADKDETAIRVVAAARQGRKPVFIRAVATTAAKIFVVPPARCLQ